MPISNMNLNSHNPLISPNISSAESNNKSLQNQITAKQQSLNRLSSDSELSAEEKEKKRQEIQREIDELNRKLKLSRMKQKDEAAEAEKKQEQKAIQKEALLEAENPKEKPNTDSHKPQDTTKKHTDFPLQDILALNNWMQREHIRKNSDTQKENAINTLESEIKLDEIYGSDTSAKEKTLSTMREKENFWLDAQKQEDEEQNMQAAMNEHAKIIIR